MPLLLKRKMETDLTENKVQKMSESVVYPENHNNDDAVALNSRFFSFQLKDKTAKKNLLAGARRIKFEKETKQKSVKLKFSAGAYMEASCQQSAGGVACMGKVSTLMEILFKFNV